MKKTILFLIVLAVLGVSAETLVYASGSQHSQEPTVSVLFLRR